MVKQIPISDKQGKTLKTIEVRFGGNTVKECLRQKKQFEKDLAAWIQCATAATKGGCTADGRATSLLGKAAMESAEKKLKKMLDGVFGPEVYEGFFSIHKPFAIIGGQFYCTQVFNVLKSIIYEMVQEDSDNE